ncbi:MAG: ABC transporter ATP-binding protein [Bacteroidia bacterium 44-10]|nr:MAG: ABC transporter ATP-binding protein [Bacteroidia bacterium 44-10]
MKFPFYKQHDSTDCGASCLRIISDYYGKKYSLQRLREACHIGKSGVSLIDISDAAESIGFRTQMFKISLDNLNSAIILPCIVHWNNNHFVVLYKIENKGKQKKYYISDPARGLLTYKENSFVKCWNNNSLTGIVLMLEPSPKFYEANEDYNDKSNLNAKFIFRYLKPHKRIFIQIILGIVIACILNLILPFLTQSIVDVGIEQNDINFVITVLIAQVMIAFGQMINSLITSRILLHTTARISISLISDFLNKLTRLPIAFFDSKKIGDILQRIQDHQRIQDFLTSALLGIIMSSFIFIIYGAVMVNYNIWILLIFLLGSTLYISWVLLFMGMRKKIDYMRFQEAAVNQNSLLQLITGMQEIKLNGCEKQKRWKWEKSQAILYGISIKSLTINQIQEVGGTFIDQTKNVIISFIAAHSVMNGSMTLGMMMALQYIIGQLNAPIKQFISFAESMQDAKLSMERLSEIHQKDDEEPSDISKSIDIPNNPEIVLKNVMFQYEGKHSPKILDDINLTIPYGKITAVVGTSGSGKTTLLKLILGFYQPVKGKITLNNKPLHDYSDKYWRKNCGVVMQEGFIFSDSIKNNIGVSDENPDIKKLDEAIKIANLEDFIESLPLGYNTEIGVDGQGLSTGQKQRILIARAAYKNAPVVIFDEATNALDANNEKVIMNNLKGFFKGKTVIVVAHRLSTVKDADNIVVLNNSKIVEQGKHNELVALKGFYYELIKNQLELGN